MASVQDVFDMAIHLMDAQNESTGATRTTDTNEYALRTPNILNTLLDEVYPYSDTYPDLSDGTKTRPSLVSVTSLDDYLDLDYYICRSVLPYGLAWLLLTEENPQQSNLFCQTYLKNLNTAKSRLPSSGIESVEDVYGGGGGDNYLSRWGGIEYGWFGQW